MTRTKLLQAQYTAIALFEAVEKKGLITAGKTELQLSNEISQLALETFSIQQHWHKKIVRVGKNTLCSYPDNPPDVMIKEDDMVVLDFGPVVDGYEADLGRTYVIGNNPIKQKIRSHVELAWYEIQQWYHQQNFLKASDLYNHAVKKANEYGYTLGGDIAGHIVGLYPHEQPIDPQSLELDVHPSNDNDLFLTDADGNDRHWILELLFIDKKNEVGSYFEQLL